MNTQERITELLTLTKREGIEKLIAYLVEGGFFSSPASTKYHGCYEGGLAEHSLHVQHLVAVYNYEFCLCIDIVTITIAALLHDVCKMGAYIGSSRPYKWNRAQPKGHALLSLDRIKKHIVLTELEEKMIRYHMGVYGLKEFDPAKGEYTLRGGAMANAWFHHPIVKVMYFCDELATLEERAEEGIE